MNPSSFSSPTSSQSLRSTNVTVFAQYLLLFIGLLFIAGTLAYYAYPLFLLCSRRSENGSYGTRFCQGDPWIFLPKKAGTYGSVYLIVSCVRLAAGWERARRCTGPKRLYALRRRQLQFDGSDQQFQHFLCRFAHPGQIRSEPRIRCLVLAPPPRAPNATPRSSQ